MHANSKTRFAVVVATLVAGLAGPAAAQDVGFYVGAALGQAEHKDACAGATTCDDKDTAWKIIAGYQFNRNLAVELGYADLGESTASGVVSGVNVSVRAELTAWEVVAVGSLPLMDRLAIYGKLGLFRGEVDLSATGTLGGFTASGSGSDSNTDLTFGFGVRYDFTRNLAVRAEWQRYPDVGGDNTGESDVDLLSVGVLFRF